MRAAGHILASAVVLLCAATTAAQAYDADWKRGRIWYRSVCTSCHAALPIDSISPSTRTRAEWAAYLKADRHDNGKETVSQYNSKDYRATIKAGNKAAEKFADVPVEDLAADLALFLDKGAKDGDSPASCN
jgi:cytochrome c5